MTVKSIFFILVILFLSTSCSLFKHYGINFSSNTKPTNRRKPIENTIQHTSQLQDRRTVKLNSNSSYKIKNNAYDNIVKEQHNKNASDILQYINKNLYIKRSPKVNAFLENKNTPTNEEEVRLL